ncbi:YceI family protein [Algoriphagus litoralis]|uniref:YceI family protein n=1 Tax=Algoriphagus litoralis TaxID=2202829 RepID=UPI000DB9356B|nr:YceI family protein [Algoriphagus litoralis]
MNKIGMLFLLIMASSCVDKSNSEVQKALVQAQQSQSKIDLLELDTIKLDMERSKLFWKGTKMRGAGSHEGEVKITQGFMLKDKNGFSGGKFEIDMKSISITDIPKTDPIPIKNLTEHLMHSDFFDVDNFPTSEFEINEIKIHLSENLEVSGNLTIRAITKNITFSAIQRGNTISAQFLIDRFDWIIAYEGSWADRTLVDRDIEFRIALVLDKAKLE